MSIVDQELELVATAIRNADPKGERFGRVLRDTLDQLYDGQRTGRYRWDQLFKTEKTHCGTLIEINLRREFDPVFSDGERLDYKIAEVEVDCKYSQKLGSWMIPPEARQSLCLLMWASDAEGKWSAGLVRVTPENLSAGSNRDGKSSLSQEGRKAILWLFQEATLPPNVLLQLPPEAVQAIMDMPHGTQRINALFRVAQGRLVGRAAIATVGKQKDFMKRIRANGGARTALKKDGIVILGPYGSHLKIAHQLGLPAPISGESIAVRLVPEPTLKEKTAIIAGRRWRLAVDTDPACEAPDLPSTSGAYGEE